MLAAPHNGWGHYCDTIVLFACVVSGPPRAGAPQGMKCEMIVGLILLGMMAGGALSVGALVSGASLGTAIMIYAATGGIVGLILCAVLICRSLLVEENCVEHVSAQQVN